MNKIDSINTQYKESTFKISHAAIGDLYCRNVREAQATLIAPLSRSIEARK